MRKTFVLLFFITFLSSCGSKKTDSAVRDDAAFDNQLTGQQIADGWKVLFDGKTLTGWRTFKNKDNDSWEVVAGTLHCKKVNDTIENKRADLMTVDQYKDFELTFDWKISPEGNSGLIYRVTEEYEVPYGSGPEFQIIDDVNYPGELKDVNLTGANYGMHAPDKNKTLRPAGEWNSSRIIIKNNHVEHWLNGGKVLEYELGSDDWKKLVNTSKWKDFPGYGLAQSGFIDLQDHGSEVWFKNLYIMRY